MERDYVLFIGFIAAIIVMAIVIFANRSSDKDKIIKSQQETIQRLINREPVTYTETGQTPQKPERLAYAAWGNQIVNLDEDRH